MPSYIQAVFIDGDDEDDVDFHRGVDSLDFRSARTSSPPRTCPLARKIYVTYYTGKYAI